MCLFDLIWDVNVVYDQKVIKRFFLAHDDIYAACEQAMKDKLGGWYYQQCALIIA